MSKFWKSLVSAAVVVGVTGSTAFAGGYEPVGKGFVAPEVFTWTGFYVGGHAGLIAGDTEGSVPGASPFFDTDFNLDGGIYGGHVGYNYQSGQVVFGIEGTYSGSNVEGDTTLLAIFGVHRDLDWLATIEGRIGYAFGRSMVYARGGWAWGELETDVDIVGIPILTGDETHNGWTAGFGFEHALGKWVTARVEYAHIDLDTENHSLRFAGGVGPIIPDNVEAEIDTIRVGVSLKFGG